MEQAFSLSSPFPAQYLHRGNGEPADIDFPSVAGHPIPPLNERVGNYTKSSFNELFDPGQLDLQDAKGKEISIIQKAEGAHVRSGHVSTPIWSSEKDEHLHSLVSKHGHDWVRIADKMAGKFPGFSPNNKQCRQHWENHARPGLKKGKWSDLETALLRQKYAIYGSSWSKYQADFPDRSQYAIKNRCRSLYGRVSKRKSSLSIAPYASSVVVDPSPQLYIPPESWSFYQGPNAEGPALSLSQILGVTICNIVKYDSCSLQAGSDGQGGDVSAVEFEADPGIPETEPVPVTDDKVLKSAKRRFDQTSTHPSGRQSAKKRKTRVRRADLCSIWTDEMDTHLHDLVVKFGYGRQWTRIAALMAQQFKDFNLSGTQCGTRWDEFVNPVLNREPWTEDEIRLLKEKFPIYGTSWKCYRDDFPDRSQNAIKNIWMSMNRRASPLATASRVPRASSTKQAIDIRNRPRVIFEETEDTPRISSELSVPESGSQSEEFDVLSFLAL